MKKILFLAVFCIAAYAGDNATNFFDSLLKNEISLPAKIDRTQLKRFIGTHHPDKFPEALSSLFAHKMTQLLTEHLGGDITKITLDQKIQTGISEGLIEIVKSFLDTTHTYQSLQNFGLFVGVLQTVLTLQEKYKSRLLDPAVINSLYYLKSEYNNPAIHGYLAQTSLMPLRSFAEFLKNSFNGVIDVALKTRLSTLHQQLNSGEREAGPAPMEGVERTGQRKTIFDVFYPGLAQDMQKLSVQEAAQSNLQINPFINSGTFQGHDTVYSIAYSPDGTHLAFGSFDKTIKILDPATMNVLQILRRHTGSVNLVAYSPDGKNLASGSWDKTIKIWDLVTGVVQTYFSDVNSVAYSPDGKYLASGSVNKSIKILDLETGSFQILCGHLNVVNSVAYSPDGKYLASGSFDGTVNIWDLATGKVLQHLWRSHTTNSSVISVAYSPDGKYVASGLANKTIEIWDPVTGGFLQTLQGHTKAVTSVAYSPDGKHLASGSDDRTIKIWDTATGQLLQTLQGHTDTVNSVAYSPDGKLASGSSDSTIKIWDRPDLTPEQAAFLLLLHSYQDTAGVTLKKIARTVGLSEEELLTIFMSFNPAVQQEIKERYRLSI